MFIEDYKNTLLEYEKFWEMKNTGRPILNISYKKEGFTRYRPYESLEEKYMQVEYAYNWFKHSMANTGYVAEGIPMHFTNFGPGCLAAAMGGSYKFTKESVWFDGVQYVTDWENPPPAYFDEQSEFWQKILEAQRLYATDPDVHYSITDIGGIMDIVASLRGTENLLYDLYDYPDEVRAFSKEVLREWFRAFDQQLKMVKLVDQPYNNWMNIPSAKPWYPIQCDFCYMISPAQFEEFVLPELVEQVKYIDRTIYHLDGPGEIPHLDMLLDIPGLNGIQWVSGAGNEPVTDEKWFGMYKKIQDKKKNLVFLNDVNERDMAGMERLIKSIDPTGVYIKIPHVSSEAKAEEIFEKITRWSE